MDDIVWSTDYPHATNMDTMCEYIEKHNMLDIDHIDGTYAEGVNCKGERYGIHAQGDGDCFNHRVTFERLTTL